MDQEKTLDRSLVKDLEPSQYLELRQSLMRTNLRNHGSLRLKLRRPSRSPAYSRSYMPGDPINLIDWKIFARTDQLLVREENDECSARILILIDFADTMAWPKLVENPTITKQEIAVRVGFHLAYIHFRMADMVLMSPWHRADPVPVNQLSLRSSTDVVTCFHNLQALNWDFDAGLEDYQPINIQRQRHDRVYWLTDGLGPSRLDWLEQSAKSIHMIHCLSSMEADVEWLGDDLCYFDQSSQRREYLGYILRDKDSYQSTLQKWRLGLATQLQKSGHSYQLVTDKTPIHEFQKDLIYATSHV